MRSLLALPLFLAAGCSPNPYAYIVQPVSGSIYEPGSVVAVTVVAVDHKTPAEELHVEVFYGAQIVPVDGSVSSAGRFTGQFVIDHSDTLWVTVIDEDGREDGAHVHLCVTGDSAACADGAVVESAAPADSGDSAADSGGDSGDSGDSGDAGDTGTASDTGTTTP